MILLKALFLSFLPFNSSLLFPSSHILFTCPHTHTLSLFLSPHQFFTLHERNEKISNNNKEEEEEEKKQPPSKRIEKLNAMKWSGGVRKGAEKREKIHRQQNETGKRKHNLSMSAQQELNQSRGSKSG